MVYKACTETGFFVISNFNEILQQQDLEKMFDLVHKFFTLPQEEKVKLKGGENRGVCVVHSQTSLIFPSRLFCYWRREFNNYLYATQ